jgi:hypothetical protein
MPPEPNGPLAPPQAPPGYAYTPTPDGYAIQQQRPGLDRALLAWSRDQPIDAAALAATPIPVIGDLAGLANDIRHYWNDPETRTPRNFTASAIGLLPLMPPALPLSRAFGKLNGAGQTAERTEEASTHEPDPNDRDLLAQLLMGNM